MELAERRGLDADVYQPAEDSQLLAETACDRLDGVSGGVVLDVGTGSGFVAGRLSKSLDCRVVASDLNPHACLRASERGVEAVRADLVEPFVDDAFDAVVFNPPYLPTDPDNEWDDWMEHALSGGESGRAVIDPFLATVGRVLAPEGVCLVLVSSLTGVDEVAERAGEEGFSAVAPRDESFPFETLTVLELRR